jgi:hypothetical protein
MFVELLEKLRCPNGHADSPLIAAATRTADRNIIEGTLGCFVCHAEYPIHAGAVDFGNDEPVPALTADALSEERCVRVGALLGLDERGGLYVLDMISSYFITELARLSPASRFVALTANPEMEGADLVIIGHGSAIPLARGCARGIALDETSPALLRSAVQALAPGGRLVAPAKALVPDGITEIARDAEGWVGVREETPVISELRRAPR